MPACPICASAKTVKNGRIHNGKQRFKCHDCGRQFIEQPSKKVIDQATRELIDRLLLERISLAGIARATQVSEQWLQTYVNQKYAKVPRQVQVTPKKREGWQSSVMNYGHLWTTKATSSGSGWHWMLTLVRLWVSILVPAMKRRLVNCGNRCLHSIANVRLLTLTFGPPMQPCSRLSGIERLVRKLARLATSSDSTIRYANGDLDLCEKPCPSRSR